MGRYPFLTQLEQYLTDRVEIRRIANSTLRNERRMLTLLHRDIQALLKANRVSTSNPAKMTEEDIMEIIRFLNTRGIRKTGQKYKTKARAKKNRAEYESLEEESVDKHISEGENDRLDIDTVAKYLQYLGIFLCWAKNPYIGRLKQQGYLPKRSTDKEIISLDDEDTMCLIEESQKVPGWDGDILAFTIPALVIQGFRGQELFKAELRDLNTRKWTFFIRYPKGGKRKQKTVEIHPTLRPYVVKYLEARERELWKRGVESSIHLFPSMTKYSVRDTPLTNTHHRRLKGILEARTSIEFDFQMLRRTSGQYLKDRGLEIEKVSRHLRHSSTAITEKSYARMRDKQASDSIGEIWSHSPIGKDKTAGT